MSGSAVYFLLCDSDPPFIKIGLTCKGERRFRELGYVCPFPLILLATLPGDRETELDLHRMFDHARTRGEWFKDCPEIRSAISEIKSGTFIAEPRQLKGCLPSLARTEVEKFIVALGDTSAVAAALDLRDSQVSNWKKRGVSWRYRPRIAAMAKRKRVDLPEGFLA